MRWARSVLWVTTTNIDGETSDAYAFNDTWVERNSGQTAWLELKVDNQIRLPKLVADGALISTAAGSTAYARAMGGSALPLGTPALVLVGSNVHAPHGWQPTVMPLNSNVELTTLDPVKRPLVAFIDGIPKGEIRSLQSRVSSTASVELAFDVNHNLDQKLTKIQFPQQ